MSKELYIKLSELNKLFKTRDKNIGHCYNSLNCHRKYDSRITSCDGCSRFLDYNQVIMEHINTLPTIDLDKYISQQNGDANINQDLQEISNELDNIWDFCNMTNNYETRTVNYDEIMSRLGNLDGLMNSLSEKYKTKSKEGAE